MTRRFVVFFLLSMASAWADPAGLLQTLWAQSDTQWVATLRASRSDVNQEFFILTVRASFDHADQGKLDEGIRYAHIADAADFVVRGEKERRCVGLGLLGRHLLEVKNYKAAVTVANAMMGESGDPYFGSLLLGLSLLRLEQHDAAVAALSRAVKMRPNAPEAHLALAAAYQLSDLRDQAEAEYKEVLRIDPSNEQARDGLDVLHGQGTMGSPLSSNATAMQHYALGERAFADKQFVKASEEYGKAIEADPRFSKAYVCLGQCHFLRGDAESAIPLYQRALQLNPNDSQAQDFCGDAFQVLYDRTHDVKYLDQAAACYQAAIDLYPEYRAARAELENVRRKKVQATAPAR